MKQWKKNLNEFKDKFIDYDNRQGPTLLIGNKLYIGDYFHTHAMLATNALKQIEINFDDCVFKHTKSNGIISLTYNCTLMKYSNIPFSRKEFYFDDYTYFGNLMKNNTIVWDIEAGIDITMLKNILKQFKCYVHYIRLMTTIRDKNGKFVDYEYKKIQKI